MSAGAARVWMLVIAASMSAVLHLWIARVTVWEVLNSNLQFVVWPGVFAAAAIQAVLPASITVHNDPLPPSFVMVAGYAFNFVAWAALFFGIGVAFSKLVQSGKVDQHGI
jgi:hypothetical protein